MTNALGLGVIGMGGGVKTEQVIQEIDRLDLSAVMILNEAGMAKEIHAARPNVEVLFRATLPGQTDDNLHTKIEPMDWVNWMNGFYLPEDIVWVCNNEPTNEYEILNGWSVELMQIMSNTTRKVVLPNFSVYNPPRGVWEAYLKETLAVMCESDGQFILGVHEYMYPSLGNKQANYGDVFMRVEEAWDVCEALGYKRPMTYITEHGFEPSWQKEGQAHSGDAEFFAEYMLDTHRVYSALGIKTFMYIYGTWVSGSGDFDIRPAMSAFYTKEWPALVPYDPTQEKPGMEHTHRLYVLSNSGSNVRNDHIVDPNNKVGAIPQGVYTGILHDSVFANGYKWLWWQDDSTDGWIASYPTDDPDDTYAYAESLDGDGTEDPDDPEQEYQKELLDTYLALANENRTLADFYEANSEYWQEKADAMQNTIGVG